MYIFYSHFMILWHFIYTELLKNCRPGPDKQTSTNSPFSALWTRANWRSKSTCNVSFYALMKSMRSQMTHMIFFISVIVHIFFYSHWRLILYLYRPPMTFYIHWTFYIRVVSPISLSPLSLGLLWHFICVEHFKNCFTCLLVSTSPTHTKLLRRTSSTGHLQRRLSGENSEDFIYLLVSTFT